MNQINGFTSCLQIWYDKRYHNKPEIRTAQFEEIFKGVDLLDYPKVFKDLLCYNFSRFTRQELPIVKYESSKTEIWRFFWKRQRNQIRSLLTCHNKKMLRTSFLWDLLQCKSLSNKVPKCFIIDSFRKHRKTMEFHPEKPSEEVLNSIRSFVKEWTRKCRVNYDGFTRIPNTHACYENVRKDGGVRGFLREKISQKNFLTHDPNQRFDPVVIHISGPPGVGKSTYVRELCNEIGKRFGYKTDNTNHGHFTYSRSGKTDHWDGYRQQLITVIDDFGFEGVSSPSGIKDTTLGELIQMCSDVDYVVPMAHLKDKGMKFTSKFLILSSNDIHKWTHSLRNQCLDHRAFSRRINPTFVYQRAFSKTFHRHELDESFHFGEPTNNPVPLVDDEGFSHFTKLFHSKQILNYAIEEYEKKFEFNSPKDGGWFQPISHFEGNPLGIRFPIKPPCSPNGNYRIPSVRACAVVESLKSRIITAPEGNTYCLKPLQLAMFKSLQEWKCFEPCWNPDFTMEKLSFEPHNKDQFLLSGDYASATDGLNHYVSKVIVEELKNQFLDVPFISSWIEYEGGNHFVEYPKSAMIPDVLQSNGQLMGSLLSFPILCIVNAWTICQATKKGLHDVNALIHGDDLAANVSIEEYESWKRISTNIGLEPSIGKNYLSQDFISIDSQLYYCLGGSLQKLKSGKFKLVRRNVDDSLTVSKALEAGFTKRHLRVYSSELLSQSFRSLNVPEDYGGLGLIDDNDFDIHEMDERDKIIYLASLWKKVYPRPIPNSQVVMVGPSTARYFNLPKGSHWEILEEDITSDDLWIKRKIQVLKRRCGRDIQFRDFVKNLEINVFPKLSSLRSIPACYTGNDLEDISRYQVVKSGLSLFKRKCLPRRDVKITPRKSCRNDIQFPRTCSDKTVKVSPFA